jgi:hypothetical protein
MPRDDGSIRHSERASLNQIRAKESHKGDRVGLGITRTPRDDELGLAMTDQSVIPSERV